MLWSLRCEARQESNGGGGIQDDRRECLSPSRVPWFLTNEVSLETIRTNPVGSTSMKKSPSRKRWPFSFVELTHQTSLMRQKFNHVVIFAVPYDKALFLCDGSRAVEWS